MRSHLPIPASEDGEIMQHLPVLIEETMSLLRPAPGGLAVDCTLGPGGHAERILEAILPGGRLIGIDRDPAAVELSRKRLERFGSAFTPCISDFREITRILARAGEGPADLILADLGVSSVQMLDPDRGFSFASDSRLDMRMDPTSGESAAQLIARLDESSLARLIRDYGEEPDARAISRAIARAKAAGPVATTGRLAEIVTRARRFRPGARIHPATRTFMALRIAVNDELTGLDRFIEAAVSSLRPGGRIGVISFHSLEDRAVKRALASLANRCTCPPDLPVCGCGRANMLRIITPRAVKPSATEKLENPRSRSAKLRVAEKL